MDKNRPPFSFVGYHLEKINYCRIGDESIKQLDFSVSNFNFDTKNGFLVLDLLLKLTFENSESEFTFSAGYEINTNIIKNDEEINNMLPFVTSSVFPFIRTQVHSITNDSREPIYIPTLDLRGIEVTKGITLKKI